MTASHACFAPGHSLQHRSSGLSPSEALTELARHAKQLQRTAQYGRKADCLPVSRRLIRTQVISHLTLPALYRQREQVQRKHLYRLLAIEAGFDSWEACRANLVSKMASGSEPVNLGLLHAPLKHSYPNLWFANPEEAHRYTAEHGGQVYTYGQHAVVLNMPLQATAE